MFENQKLYETRFWSGAGCVWRLQELYHQLTLVTCLVDSDIRRTQSDYVVSWRKCTMLQLQQDSFGRARIESYSEVEMRLCQSFMKVPPLQSSTCCIDVSDLIRVLRSWLEALSKLYTSFGYTVIDAVNAWISFRLPTFFRRSRRRNTTSWEDFYAPLLWCVQYLELVERIREHCIA